MIPLDEYLAAVDELLDGRLNDPQRECVCQPPQQPLMIVAGPGSGKTRVLVLRALRHLLVDGMAPEAILITTFTRKAAGELSSRILAWGLRLVEHFLLRAQETNNAQLANWLGSIDVNAIQTGTLDSFCQQWLGLTRSVGVPTPVMLEQFAANFVYRRRVFSPIYRNGAAAVLNPYLQRFSFEQTLPRTQGEAAALSVTLNNRLIQDLVDTEALFQRGGPEAIQVDLLRRYREHLRAQQLYDFSLCAEHILTCLRNGTLLPRVQPPLRAVLVDEYQDTNPLQEAIYFELVVQSGAAFAVVGDDDQALYRFRGATVELFTNFPARLEQRCGAIPRVVYLATNHRSTPEIVAFFNTYVSHDPDFAPARVGGKPAIQAFNASTGIPVLGMFRDTLPELADDLAGLLRNVFAGDGHHLPNGLVLRRHQHEGALGDAVLLASTVREFKPSNSGPVAWLPALLRQRLETAGAGVFNPRGQDLRDIPSVQTLLGLVAHCLNLSGAEEAAMPLTTEARNYIALWKARAQSFVAANPRPPSTIRGSLRNYVESWQTRRASRGDWPGEVPLLDLLYKLIVWMPEFQNDPEHQVYLEAIMRCVAQGAHYSSYDFLILNATPHDRRSRSVVYSDLFEPIAQKLIEIDEDLLFAIPRHRLSIMTIHQSKGLEFPLVIVDVGSEFRTAHAKQRFKRFPDSPSSPVEMESALSAFTEVGPLRTARDALQRTFDDLTRLYYVAYSRAQSALLLVGLRRNIEYGTRIQNVATFWRRDGSWTWRRDNPPLSRRAPTLPESHPLLLM